jgi:hypothetical protein
MIDVLFYSSIKQIVKAVSFYLITWKKATHLYLASINVGLLCYVKVYKAQPGIGLDYSFTSTIHTWTMDLVNYFSSKLYFIDIDDDDDS